MALQPLRQHLHQVLCFLAGTLRNLLTAGDPLCYNREVPRLLSNCGNSSISPIRIEMS